MLLSIIIVNYNVKYFLEQCLCSVDKALRSAGLTLSLPAADPEVPQSQIAEAALAGSAYPEIPQSSIAEAAPVGSTGPTVSEGSPSPVPPAQPPGAEIFVVDNNSSDGSADWLPARFPAVRFILNKENRGFAVANNQALARAKGKYVLFLNPDTILPEDCFPTCIAFMESHPGAGAAGLRMIDGGGRFLMESRRGFPSPWVAFCKLAGLTRLFPRSARFATYYLGHLPSSEDHPAPVLPGAFMFVRKQALERTGGFDERFFLYAEDIDLSYRIEQAGYANYYIAGSTILHFKGESTQKDTRYVKLFYKAMSQFRRKHFQSSGSLLFNSLLEAVIWLRGGMEAVRNTFRTEKMRQPTAAGRIWIGGDQREAARLKALLSSRNRLLSPGPEQADELIFCEGEGFTFKDIITALQGSPPRGVYRVHACGTAAAVGSPSKKERGNPLVL